MGSSGFGQKRSGHLWDFKHEDDYFEDYEDENKLCQSPSKGKSEVPSGARQVQTVPGQQQEEWERVGAGKRV